MSLSLHRFQWNSLFIWNIDIIGNSRISKEELLQTLKDNGLKVGEFKDNIRTKEIVDNIRLKRDDIAWIGVEIKGTNAIVKVVEADEAYAAIEAIDSNSYFKDNLPIVVAQVAMLGEGINVSSFNAILTASNAEKKKIIVILLQQNQVL